MAYPITSALIKISICCALLRLTMHRSYRLLIWAMIVVTCAMNSIYITTQTVAYVQASHVSQYDPLVVVNQFALFLVYIAVDAGCTILPVVFLWNLQMDAKEKVSTALLFAMGLL